MIEVISDSCPKFIPMTLVLVGGDDDNIHTALGIRVDILINRVRCRCMGSKL